MWPTGHNLPTLELKKKKKTIPDQYVQIERLLPHLYKYNVDLYMYIIMYIHAFKVLSDYKK